MRLPVSAIILPFIAAALFSENLAAAAQSANPYPWCAIYYKEGGGTPRCYFDTRDQCMASISGIGGFCIANQYYHGAAVQPPRRVHVMRKRPSTHSHQRPYDSHAGLRLTLAFRPARRTSGGRGDGCARSYFDKRRRGFCRSPGSRPIEVATV
jgi:hypothetical protein